MLTLLALLQAAATPVPATPAPPAPGSITVEPVAMMVAAFDADADGRVARAEFDAGVARTFPAGDAMSLLDLSGWARQWLGDQGAVPGQYDFDRDGDNSISRAEYAAEFARIFDRLDANRDAVLDRFELVRIADQRPGPDRREKRAPPPPRR